MNNASVSRILRFAKKKRIDTSWLSDMVMDQKQQAANRINSKGGKAQVKYLLSCGFTRADIIAEIRRFDKVRNNYLKKQPSTVADQLLVPYKIQRALAYKKPKEKKRKNKE